MQLPEESHKAVAVVVPVYNRLDLLRDTVESLRAQTLPEAEFILVDDRSDDDVWEYLQRLPAQDSRFMVLRKPEDVERGCQASRNIGLDASTARSVVFLDSDDLLTPGCLESRYQVLSDSTSVDLVVGRQAIFRSGSQILHWVNIPSAGNGDLDRFLRLAGRLDVPWINGGVLIRRESLVRCGIRWRPEFYWDDVVFHFECLLAGLRAHWLDFDAPPDSYYRNHSAQRYGNTLASLDGLANSTSMLCWMRRQLDEADKSDPARNRDLVISFFHACFLRALDDEKYDLARDLVSQAVSTGLITAGDSRRFNRFRMGRQVLGFSARASYYWDRLARRSFLEDEFRTGRSTYGTEMLVEHGNRSIG